MLKKPFLGLIFVIFQIFRSEAQDFTRFFSDTSELQSANRFVSLSNGKFWIGGNRLPDGSDELKVWISLLGKTGLPEKRFRLGGPGFQSLAGLGLLGNGKLACVFGQKGISGITENFVALLDSQQVLSVQKINGADDAILDDAKITSKGKIIVCGFKGFPQPAGNNFFVAQVNPNTAEMEWVFDEGFSPNDHIKNTIETADGNFVICGDVQTNTYNPYVAKLDTNGQLIWDLVVTSPWNDGSQKLAEDSIGRIWMVGESSTFSSPLFDNQLTLISPQGQLLWQQLLGSDGQDAAFLIKKAEKNGFWVGGYSNASTGGQGPISPYLMRLNRNGESLGEAFWPFQAPSPVYDFAVVGDSVFFFAGISDNQGFFMKRTRPALSSVFVLGNQRIEIPKDKMDHFWAYPPFRVFDILGKQTGVLSSQKQNFSQSGILILRNEKGESKKLIQTGY
jgi:hypothetical protein